MQSASIFSNQYSSGQIPTLMINRQEKKRQLVDTLAITMVAVYLAQLHKNWSRQWGINIQKALDFIEWRLYQNEIENFPVWHFNAFFPPDWEDTSFALFLLITNGRLKISQLEKLRELLINNTTELGTGVWVKDPYSKNNARNNHWDPTSAINILRLHYLLETEEKSISRVERFVKRNLLLDQFNQTSLYYTPPVAAFFARRLIEDFLVFTNDIAPTLVSFHQEVVKAVNKGFLNASPFERALIGLSTTENDNGLIFHHGRRTIIWYGSPVLHALATIVLG